MSFSTTLAAVRSLALSAVPTANRFAALSISSGVTVALVSTLTPLLGKIPRMSLKHVFYAFVAVLLFAGPALANPEGDNVFVEGGLTSDQAAARASVRSPTVERKAAELDAAIASVSAAKLQRVPRVSTKLSYTRLSNLDVRELAPGVSFPVLLDSYVAQAQIVVPLSDYVLRHPRLIGAARAGERAARIGKRASELDAGTEARIAYYEWVRARLQLVVAKRQVTQVRATLAQVRALADAQRVARVELLRVESLEADAEQTYDRLRTLASLREEMLRLQIGAGTNESLTIGEDLRTTAVAPPSAPLEQIAATALRQRLELKGLDLAIEATEQRNRAEQANRLPQLSAFAVTEYTNPNQRAFPPANTFTWTWSAGAQVTWTLNDALIANTASRRLTAEIRGLRADREGIERAMRIAVLAAQQNVETATQALATTAKGLVAAEEGYRVRMVFLDAERGTAVELVDAETNLTRARIAALDARVDLRIALAELHHALGNDTK